MRQPDTHSQMAGINAAGQPTLLKVADDGSLTATVTGASTQRTPTITTVTGSGTVAAGSRKLTFVFSSDFAGSVLGATFSGPTDNSVTIDAPSGDTLGAVIYTVTAGSVRIIQIA